MGTESSPSIWVCGIEWGGGWCDEAFLKEEITAFIDTPPEGYADR